MDNNELMHYGVLGMKWGRRKARGSAAAAKRKRANTRVKESRKKDLKRRRTLSDEDLKKRIDRLKMEKEFKNLTKEDIAPGRKATAEILSSAGKKIATAAVAGAVAYGVKAAMTKKFDLKEAAAYVAANPNKKK